EVISANRTKIRSGLTARRRHHSIFFDNIGSYPLCRVIHKFPTLEQRDIDPNPLSRIIRLTDREASGGCLVCDPPPQPCVSPATERTADTRNVSFPIVEAPFRTLSPKLDLRTHLIRKITKPHGRRNAKVSRKILRAVITPRAMSPMPCSTTQPSNAMRAPTDNFLSPLL